MSGSIRFQTGDCWEYDGLRLRFERELGDHLLHFVVERTLAPFQVEDAEGGLLAPDTSWAVEAFSAGRLRQISDRRGLPATRREAAKREYDPETASAMDPSYRLRRFVLDGLDAKGHANLGERAIRRALVELWLENPTKSAAFDKRPAARTVKRWLESRGAVGERQTRQLVSMSGRVARRRRLQPVILVLLQRAALDYWTDLGRSMEDAYARFSRILFYINDRRRRQGSAIAELQLPSQETLRKEIRRLECFDTYAAKFGEKKAKVRFKANGQGLTATRFLRLGCMDHTLLDVVAFDTEMMLPMGRPWLTVLIDVRTRCIVGFVLTFENPSNFATTECIKRANLPKLHLRDRFPRYPVLADIYGRFDEIIVDNGWELSGVTFEDMMADLGTTVRWAPVRSPTYKAPIERFFGVLNHLLHHKLPGGVLKPELLRELGYEPAKAAVLTIAELESLIWTTISYYHIEEHSTLGCPPASLWERDMNAYGIDVIGDDRQLDKMAGALKPACRVTRSGVEMFGLQFHEPAATAGLLEDLISYEPVRGQRKGSATVVAKAKYNPANLAEIHVWNRRRNLYVTLPCTDERYTEGLSLWHHQQLQKWTQAKGLLFSSERDRLLARAALIAEFEAIAPELKLKQRRAVARLTTSERVREGLGNGSVTVATAPARHDGLAPIIEHEALAINRTDGGQAPKRPPRGGVKRARPKPISRPAPIQKADAKANSEVQAPLVADKWKGFKL